MDLSLCLLAFFLLQSRFIKSSLQEEYITRAAVAAALKQTSDRQPLKLPGQTDFSNGGVMINPRLSIL